MMPCSLTRKIKGETIEIQTSMIAINSPLMGMKHGTAGSVVIREIPGLPMFDLRVAPGTPAQASIETVLGFQLPAKTGQTAERPASESTQCHALCLAPDWWLVTGSVDAGHDLVKLRQQGEHHFSIVDVSGQRTTIDLEGSHARDVLAHLWEQDLREKIFPVGSVSQGLMVKSPVIVWHFAPSHYRILVRSSFAVHLWQALTDAAVEYIS